MKPNYEEQLERAVQRELDSLPELEAPPQLAVRILSKLRRADAVLPWYRCAWSAWSLPLRVTSMVGLLAAWGAIGFSLWQFLQTRFFAGVSQRMSETIDSISLFERVGRVLLNSLKLALSSLSPLQLGLLIVSGVACYAVCVGMGTLYYRLAFMRR
jgi:hypothetical protein